MKILKFEAENIKRLRVVEITPEGELVIISGENEQGKTSILDGIAFALANAAYGKSQPMPLRKGEKRGHVTLTLGDGREVEFIVTRTFTEKASYLSVTDPKGFKASAPQEILDAIVGAIALDPVEFLRQKPREQFETLRALTGLDFATQDRERQRLYDERRDHNRDLANARGQLAGIQVAATAPYEPVEIGDVLEELEAAEQTNRQRNEDAGRITSLQSLIAKLDGMIAELEDKLVAARESRATNAAKLITVESSYDPSRIDLAPLRAKIAAANETNAKASAWAERKRQYDELATRVEKLAARSESYDASIAAIDRDKAAKIAAAAMPIEGLGFGDGIVTYGPDAIPLQQAADSTQLMVSMAIAAAMNPKLRVLRVRDGSLLDRKRMAMVAEFAKARDLQVWMEVVESTDASAIIIEDGMVRGAAPVHEGEPAEEPEAQLALDVPATTKRGRRKA